MTERYGAVRERLAALEHEQWSGWMMWLFKRSALHADGSVTIPPDLVARWKRQMLTDYAALSEDEQRSDLAEADKVLALLEEMGGMTMTPEERDEGGRALAAVIIGPNVPWAVLSEAVKERYMRAYEAAVATRERQGMARYLAPMGLAPDDLGTVRGAARMAAAALREQGERSDDA